MSGVNHPTPDERFSSVRIGDRVVWRSGERYYGDVIFTVEWVTPKRFGVVSTLGPQLPTPIRQTYRRLDGRVIGAPHNIYFVEPA